MGSSEGEAGCAWLSRFVDEALSSSGIDYRMLAAALRQEIATEQIPVGGRLPSQRELARRLAVGRTTVVGAYDVLRSESLVRSQQGAGTWVVRRPDRP
jgi:DNA-binding GntR family transcriptional regulator